MIKVSVLMPAYNAERTIGYAVESILSQDYINFELIICDDCSTDGTVGLIGQIKDPRVRLIRNSVNIGSLKTRNVLASHAKGEFIAWQDSDDVSHPHRLKSQIDFLNGNDDIALCGVNFFRVYPFWKRFIKSNYPLCDSNIRNYIQRTRNIPFCAPSIVIRTSVFHEVGGMRDYFKDYGWYDFDLILRVMKKYKVANIRETFYEYRYYAKSSSRKIIGGQKIKLFINDVGFFINNCGESSIDMLKVEKFVEKISSDRKYDCSYEYYLAAKNFRSNLFYSSALTAATFAIIKSPRLYRNYYLFIIIVISLLKSVISYPLNCLRYWYFESISRK